MLPGTPSSITTILSSWCMALLIAMVTLCSVELSSVMVMAGEMGMESTPSCITTAMSNS